VEKLRLCIKLVLILAILCLSVAQSNPLSAHKPSPPPINVEKIIQQGLNTAGKVVIVEVLPTFYSYTGEHPTLRLPGTIPTEKDIAWFVPEYESMYPGNPTNHQLTAGLIQGAGSTKQIGITTSSVDMKWWDYQREMTEAVTESQQTHPFSYITKQDYITSHPPPTICGGEAQILVASTLYIREDGTYQLAGRLSGGSANIYGYETQVTGNVFSEENGKYYVDGNKVEALKQQFIDKMNVVVKSAAYDVYLQGSTDEAGQFLVDLGTP
jgi:hypothetical protein